MYPKEFFPRRDK